MKSLVGLGCSALPGPGDSEACQCLLEANVHTNWLSGVAGATVTSNGLSSWGLLHQGYLPQLWLCYLGLCRGLHGAIPSRWPAGGRSVASRR